VFFPSSPKEESGEGPVPLSENVLASEGKCLQCFDAVGWVAGRAFSL